MKPYLLLVGIFAIAACDNTPPAAGDGGHDLSAYQDFGAPDHGSGDLTKAPDFSGISCGATSCTGGQVCCVLPGPTGDGGATFSYTCAGSCADGGVALSCDGPNQCPTSAPICCGQIDVGPGTPPDCPLLGGGSQCVASCPVSFQFCPAMEQVILCHQKSDCTDPGYPNCCPFAFGGGTQVFCVDATLMPFATGNCF